MTEKRRNREALPIRLRAPVYDVANGGSVTATVKAVDGDDAVSGETTHYTAGAGIAVAIVYSITLCNNDTVNNQVSVHLVENGGSRTAANRIFSDLLAGGETVVLEGPWFLDPSDTIRSISSTAAANEVGLRAEVLEMSSVVPGVTLIVDDGSALTTSKAAYYTCPASNVQHANAVAITACNTDTASRTVTVEIRPSGGSASDRQNLFNATVNAGETVILGGADAPFVLEPGDAVYAMASAGSVVGLRVSAVEYATT
jgi:hypothetical protein